VNQIEGFPTGGRGVGNPLAIRRGVVSLKFVPKILIFGGQPVRSPLNLVNSSVEMNVN
jgi:hypothetical protein